MPTSIAVAHDGTIHAAYHDDDRWVFDEPWPLADTNYTIFGHLGIEATGQMVFVRQACLVREQELSPHMPSRMVEAHRFSSCLFARAVLGDLVVAIMLYELYVPWSLFSARVWRM